MALRDFRGANAGFPHSAPGAPAAHGGSTAGGRFLRGAKVGADSARADLVRRRRAAAGAPFGGAPMTQRGMTVVALATGMMLGGSAFAQSSSQRQSRQSGQ